MEKPLKGTFITLEGGEGSGKSTIMNLLKQELEKQGHSVLATMEPGGSDLGRQIRSWLLTTESQVTSLSELLLFLADRSQHIHETIRPALEDGKIVLCDRFNDSTIAYQGFARGLDVPKVEEFCDLVSGMVQPRLTILLDIEPKKGLERAKNVQKSEAGKGEADRIESEDIQFHVALRRGFHWLSEEYQNRIITIDASQSIDAVLQESIKAVTNVL